MYADVLIQYSVKSIDHTFTYRIPSFLKDIIKTGMKVSVPFGKQTLNGFVINIKDTNDCDYEIKDIINVIGEFTLNSELMELGKYIKSKTLSTLVASYQVILPTSLKINNQKESYDLIKTYVSLNNDVNIDEYINNNKRSKRQIEIINLLKNGELLKTEINGSSLKTLIDKNIVIVRTESVFRINHNNSLEKEKELTEEQNKAYLSIKKFYNKERTILLHGITGSGKTEVYMHIVSDMIKENKSVIVLVPEISLTTQIVKRFYDRFGDDVAILHSNLSDGEKADEYKKISNGLVHIVVGTRSAIFAPLNNIGAIIIDEEHTQSYKQDNNPRYNAIDIAIWRSKYHSIPLILGSATPTLETMARALKGVYEYVTLNKRVGNAKLPYVHIVDMAPEFKKRNNILSEELQHAIMNRLDSHEQVMLLINRRGFSTIISCQSCGYTYKCPNCDITLTYHKSNNHLRCHYCGYTTFLNNKCPECGEDAIRDFGLGSEKVEEYVKKLYPSYKVIRMDRDTTSKKGSHEEIIHTIEEGNADIIIGTQMISKGFDFPKVTLVGIINADESLNIPDFRSGEVTYSLLSQVSGRAGRGDIPGEVIIQTFNPDSKTLINVCNNDYMKNYEYEMNIRKQLKYPPYYYITSIKVTSKNYDVLSKEVTKIADYLKRKLDDVIILGPTTANPFRINNIYRFNIVIKYRSFDKINKNLIELDNIYMTNNQINFEIDVDPLHI